MNGLNLSKKMIPLIQKFKTVVLANGDFPSHKIPLEALLNADHIICCDGVVQNLLNFGLKPSYIIGDLDSISEELKKHFFNILVYVSDQETNDLTKAVDFCCKMNLLEITVLGATGKREDHTLGNLSLLLDYAEKVKIQLFSDYGVFNPIFGTSTFESYSGQQISIFSFCQNTCITSQNLIYPLLNRKLNSLWEGSLNESNEKHFDIQFDKGKVLIFRKF